MSIERWIIKIGRNTAAAPHPSKATAALIFKTKDDAKEWQTRIGRGTVRKIMITLITEVEE